MYAGYILTTPIQFTNTMNFDSFASQDLNGVFKIANLVVAGLSVVSGVSQIFNGIQSFLLALYIISFGVVIGFLEYSVPQEAFVYASFLFSFIGRGVFYTLIASIINGASFFRVFASLIIFIIGLVYIGLEAVPSISTPDNMRSEGVTLDEEII